MYGLTISKPPSFQSLKLVRRKGVEIDEPSSGERLSANGEPLQWLEDGSSYKRDQVGNESQNILHRADQALLRAQVYSFVGCRDRSVAW